jgi:hypothetical protein
LLGLILITGDRHHLNSEFDCFGYVSEVLVAGQKFATLDNRSSGYQSIRSGRSYTLGSAPVENLGSLDVVLFRGINDIEWSQDLPQAIEFDFGSHSREQLLKNDARQSDWLPFSHDFSQRYRRGLRRGLSLWAPEGNRPHGRVDDGDQRCLACL